MSSSLPLSFVLYLMHAIVVPPLLVGFIRTGKARLQNRQGPPLGASREAAVSIQAEPALVIALAALATHAHSSAFSALLAPGQGGPNLFIVVPLVVVALWLAAMAELARMPVDDPTTHLELTMIHEALILENSGRNLALVEVAGALKMTVLFGLIVKVLLIVWPPFPPALTYLLSLGMILAAGAAVALAESVLVKLRWRRIPNLLSFALTASVLACLVVAMKG